MRPVLFAHTNATCTVLFYILSGQCAYLFITQPRALYINNLAVNLLLIMTWKTCTHFSIRGRRDIVATCVGLPPSWSCEYCTHRN